MLFSRLPLIITSGSCGTARNHQISWQRDFFDHRLRDHHAEIEKTQYILMNPVRKGLCERMEEWQWVCRPPTRLPPRLGY